MKNIHENKKTNKLFNQVKSAMALQGLTIRKWAIAHNEPYTLVYQVTTGEGNKLKSPLTRCNKVCEMLKAEGFWPADEAQP